MIRALPGLLLIVALAACGSDGGSDGGSGEEKKATSGEPAARDLPKCTDIWKDGATLPDDYDGCGAVEGETVGPIDTCDNGVDTFATYVVKDADGIETPYFALLDGKVIKYTDDENGPYAVAYRKCRAG